MKRATALLMLSVFILLCVPGAFALEEGLSVIRITCNGTEPLSQEEAISAYVCIEATDHTETAFWGEVSLNASSQDYVDGILPQRSLLVKGDAVGFVLENNGADALRTEIINALCSSLLSRLSSGICVCAAEPVEVYLNGEYMGIYSRRESVKTAVTRFEKSVGPYTLNIANAGGSTVYGDATGLKKALKAFSEGGKPEELAEILDIESLLEHMAVNMYFGCADIIGNLNLYQVNDGLWKCVTLDFPYAYFKTPESPAAALKQSQHGYLAETVYALLEYPEYMDLFCEKLSVLYRELPTDVMRETAEMENARIASALPAHMERWTDETIKALKDAYPIYSVSDAQEALRYQRYRVYYLRDVSLVKYPWDLCVSMKKEFDLPDEVMDKYFGTVIGTEPEVTVLTPEEFYVANP